MGLFLSHLMDQYAAVTHFSLISLLRGSEKATFSPSDPITSLGTSAHYRYEVGHL